MSGLILVQNYLQRLSADDTRRQRAQFGISKAQDLEILLLCLSCTIVSGRILTNKNSSKKNIFNIIY